MNFQDFIGLPAQAQSVIDDLRSARGVHAYLFSGPGGTGKRSFAEVCARAANCAGAHKPCNECPSCKLYLSESHPDHIVLQPEKSIGVDRIRDLIAHLSQKPFEGGRFTVIIRQADQMTNQAQNALLKTLESPPGDVVFFLLTESPGALFSTILSRTRQIRFTAATDEDMRRALAVHGISADRAAALIRDAGGSIGLALQRDKDEEYWPLRERVVRALELGQKKTGVGDAAMLLRGDQDAADAVFQIMEAFAREHIIRAESSDNTKSISSEKAERLLRGIMTTKMQLSSNVSWQYATEMLFFTLAGGN